MNGIEAISRERARQVSEELFSLEHDDNYKNGELAQAAAAYAYPEGEGVTMIFQDLRGGVLFPADWDALWWKPSKGEFFQGRKRELEKAGALIAAELDRLDRLERKLKNFDGKDIKTLIWTDWYELLQEYSFILGHERELITECGEECWREAYINGLDIPNAFRDGFEG